MENRRKIRRKLVEYSSSFWCSYPFGLCVLILNWSNNRKARFREGLALFEQKNWLQFWWKIVLFLENRFGCGEIRFRFLGKSVTDFGQTGSVFGKNMLRFWGEQAPLFRKNWLSVWEKQDPFLGQTGSVFEKNKLQFWDSWLRFGVEIGSVFGLAWDKSSSLTALNAKHVWVWIFEVLGLGVTKNKSTAGKLEG